MALDADLYVDRMDLRRYASGPTCDICRVDSFDAFVARLRSGAVCAGACPHWPESRVAVWRLAVEAGQWLPRVPSLDTPRPGETGLTALGEPDPSTPVLVTGNSQLTHEVLLAILSHTTAPLWLAMADTDGHTVDMAVVFGVLTADRIVSVLRDLPGELEGRRVVLPGLAAGVGDALAAATGAAVNVGPICAAELPLHLGKLWCSAE